ncbi:MAG: hypothetical protein ACK4K7_03135 [Allosphingosinicella sp.]|uniref:hypothetical protein n=1 Tax=Allosphingosinicella sp. TaxID=2823234 RepID=UPI00395C6840
MIVTAHARQRWCERIDPRATLEEAAAAMQLSSRAVEIAAAFGCRVVRTGAAKLVLEGETVVTVIPRNWICREPVAARTAEERA